MTFWGATMWFLIGAATCCAPWAFFYGKIVNRLMDARLNMRKLEDLFQARLKAFLESGRLPAASKEDADALLAESQRALGEGMKLSPEDEAAANKEGLK